jgi:Rod binding domain-containing protein
MDSGMNIADSALTALQNQPLTAQTRFRNDAAMDKAARRVGESQSGQNKNDAAISKAAAQFESVFISQFLGSMFSGLKTDGPFGGGQGEEMFRSLMIDKYADGLAAQGGFGLASSVKAQMLKMQEAQP